MKLRTIGLSRQWLSKFLALQSEPHPAACSLERHRLVSGHQILLTMNAGMGLGVFEVGHLDPNVLGAF